MQSHKFIRPCILIFFLMCLFVTGCGSSDSGGNPNEPPIFDPLQVLVPEAPGKETIGSPPLILDISNQENGYLVASSQSDSSRTNLQLAAPDGVLYSYFLEPSEEAVIPFSSGDGEYFITCYEQIDGSQYAALYSETLEITLKNEFYPFLYPNQYVKFTPESEASKLALSMLPEDATDIEALDEIYQYVTENIVYDDEKALTVEAGYLPDVDETLETGIGICFDYAALITAMLRSRDIPCRLQIGYSGDIKHAWIDVYIRSKGWVNKAIAFDGDTWTRMDPTFDSSSDGNDDILSYIGDGTNYTVQFTR